MHPKRPADTARLRMMLMQFSERHGAWATLYECSEVLREILKPLEPKPTKKGRAK